MYRKCKSEISHYHAKPLWGISLFSGHLYQVRFAKQKLVWSVAVPESRDRIVVGQTSISVVIVNYIGSLCDAASSGQGFWHRVQFNNSNIYASGHK